MGGDLAAFAREEADNYATVIAHSSDLRVIVCRNDHQWILQMQTGGRWRAIGFFRSRDALVREWTRAGGPMLAEIMVLPAHFRASNRGQSGVKTLQVGLGPERR